MWAWTAVVAVLGLAALGGCSGGDEPSFTMPTTPPRGAMEGAMLPGLLTVKDGCLGVQAEDGFVLVLWSDGSSADGDELVTPRGERFQIGDRVVLGGGESFGDGRQLEADDALDECREATGTGRIWVGGGASAG